MAADAVVPILFSVGILLGIAIPMDLTLYGAVAIGVNWAVALFHAIPYQSEKFYDFTGSATFITLVTLSFVSSVSMWRTVVTTALVLVWAGRLGSFLFERIHASGIDPRFNRLRSSPPLFFMAWTMQSLWNFITLLPVLLVHASPATHQPSLQVLDVVGLAIWALGFGIEVIADSQKRAFRMNQKTPKTFISSGLWAFSRHPNYFGEILLWCGMVVFCLPHLPSAGSQLLVWLCPLLVATLLLFVSGAPLIDKIAEKRWGSDPAYVAYKRRTSFLVPWFPSA